MPRPVKGEHISVETEFKIGHRPYYISPENLKRRGEKISIALKGRTPSIETRQKLSLANRNKKGPLSPSWRGGISSKEYKLKKKELLAGRPRPLNCEICSSTKKIQFDHCHRKGNFRGWICGNCNRTLGLVGDSITLLTQLIEYLKKDLCR